jgi:hypothetical protein
MTRKAVRAGHAPKDLASAEGAEPEPSHGLEGAAVSGDQAQTVLESRCGDQGVREPHARLAAHPAGPFGHRPVHTHFAVWRQKQVNQPARRGACVQLCSADHRVVQAMGTRFQRACPA